MINRLFKYNRFFSMLFLLSYFVSFMIMYYGLDLNRQFVRVGEVKTESAYKYGYTVAGPIAEDVKTSDDIEDEMTIGGNIIFRCEGPVGEGVINTDNIDILWTQQEPLPEPIKYQDYYLNGQTDGLAVPKCIIGDAWRDDTYVIDGIRYIKIYQIESCVVGEYLSDTFAGMDERCLVYRDGLSQEQLDKLLFATGFASVFYKSNLYDGRELFREWTYGFVKGEEKETTEMPSTYENIFKTSMPFYRKAYAGMLILCFINCAFLASFWGEIHLYEHMLKRALGYGRRMLFADVVSRFAVYEVISLAAVLAVTCGYELLWGSLADWCDNLRLGFGQLAAVLVLFGVALSLFPMRLVLKQKPADVLKNTE